MCQTIIENALGCMVDELDYQHVVVSLLFSICRVFEFSCLLAILKHPVHLCSLQVICITMFPLKSI